MADNSGLRVGAASTGRSACGPLINARGTFTIISGSTMLPEVRAAMDAAAQHYVHLDELTDAIGARLATLTGAEWGLVTSGCSAALTHATAACVAGGNPDLHVRIPNLTGLPEGRSRSSRKHSRNVYDAALRAVGVRVVEVTTLAEFEAALGPRTAMVYILAGPNADDEPAQREGDRADREAQGRADPRRRRRRDPRRSRTCTCRTARRSVAYSGGKVPPRAADRGPAARPQGSGRAAWVHSAPHHGLGRALKVGKEEAIGMLMAVEMWVKRDHDAEWKTLERVARSHRRARVGDRRRHDGRSSQPEGSVNRTPSLRVLWDPERVGVSGETVARDAARRRAAGGRCSRARGGAPARDVTGVSVTPYDAAGRRRRSWPTGSAPCSAHPARGTPRPRPRRRRRTSAGQWNVQIEYARRQRRAACPAPAADGAATSSVDAPAISSRAISPARSTATTVRLRSTYDEQHGDALNVHLHRQGHRRR